MDRSDFATFFTAVRPGQRPFAWQERLLDALLQDGCWPDRIVAPTGAGKTAVVDVHVFANALAALGQAPRLPRRLALVVDRRAVVDSHDEHARDIARSLTQDDGDVLGEVSRALRSLRVDLAAAAGVEGPLELDAPLLTVRMRGGAPAPRAWRDHPEACAVLTATPDMLGSRLLLQGYTSSRRAWPREAGLLALDTVLVVDEAHLSRQFLATARRVPALTPTGALIGSVPQLQVVETTATPAAGVAGTEVGVEPADVESDEVLRRRMTTPKPVQLLPLPAWPVAPKGAGLRLLVEQIRLAREELGPTVGVVVNRVTTAVELARQLEAAGLVVELLVGRMRPADVAHLRRRRPGLLDTTGNAEVDVLVATQTVEVGLDLDLSALVTELAPGAALAQRSGRVNRRGDRASTRVVIAVPTGSATVPDKGAQPYSGQDLTDALRWVTSRAASADGLAPWSLRLAPPPGQALRRTLLRRLELTDSWAWAATGDLPFARPDLALWLADDLSADRDCWLVVRDDLPTDALRAVELLRLLPPRPHELFQVPRSQLQNLLPGWFADPAEGPPPAVLRWRDAEVEVLDVDSSLRTGDVVVLDASTPIQVRGVVLDDPAREPAVDVFQALTGRDLEAVRGRVALRWGTTHDGQPARSLLPHAVRELLAEGPAGQRGDWARDQREALGKALALADVDGATAELLTDRTCQRNAAAALLQHGRVKDSALTVLADENGRPAILVVRDLRRVVADEDVRQTWTPADQPVPLQQHAAAVASAAAQLAARLGLGEDTADLLRLAGQHHDDGKTDPRFQRVLGRTADDPLLAKSANRQAVDDAADRSRAGLPIGWRHEQLSALHAWRAVDPTVRELVARLAGTTHGHGRHSFPHGAASLLGLPSHEVPADARALFDDGEWEQLMQDTDEQHGVWAMAYVEAVLRAADGRVSAAGS